MVWIVILDAIVLDSFWSSVVSLAVTQNLSLTSSLSCMSASSMLIPFEFFLLLPWCTGPLKSGWGWLQSLSTSLLDSGVLGIWQHTPSFCTTPSCPWISGYKPPHVKSEKGGILFSGWTEMRRRGWKEPFLLSEFPARERRGETGWVPVCRPSLAAGGR